MRDGQRKAEVQSGVPSAMSAVNAMNKVKRLGRDPEDKTMLSVTRQPFRLSPVLFSPRDSVASDDILRSQLAGW